MRTCIVTLVAILLVGCAPQRDSASAEGGVITELENPAAPYDTAGVSMASLEDSLWTGPSVVSKVNPEFPESALEDSLEGTVMVHVLVTPTGEVSRARVFESDNEIFNRPSLEAAIQWKFEPPMRDGEAFATWLTIPFRYKISRN